LISSVLRKLQEYKLPVPSKKSIQMAKKERKTAHNEPGLAWQMIWNELRRAGISPDQIGPIEGTIHWGSNAQTAVRRLQESKLPPSDVDNIGMLLQAAIHAAEIFWRPDDFFDGRPRKRLTRRSEVGAHCCHPVLSAPVTKGRGD
jgi:hypothetical protein